MSWKQNIQLLDLGDGQPLEVTCRKCGHSRYEQPSELLRRDELKHAWLDEVEAALTCKQRGCHAPMRIALSTETETEGFMGGLA